MKNKIILSVFMGFALTMSYEALAQLTLNVDEFDVTQCTNSNQCGEVCGTYDCGLGSCVGSCNGGVCQYPNWDGSGWSDC